MQKLLEKYGCRTKSSSVCPDQQNEIKYHLERERMKRKKLSTKKIRKRRKGQEAIKNKTK